MSVDDGDLVSAEEAYRTYTENYPPAGVLAAAEPVAAENVPRLALTGCSSRRRARRQGSPLAVRLGPNPFYNCGILAFASDSLPKNRNNFLTWNSEISGLVRPCAPLGSATKARARSAGQ